MLKLLCSVYNIFLQSGISSGLVKLVVCAELPVEGASHILGNDFLFSVYLK